MSRKILVLLALLHFNLLIYAQRLGMNGMPGLQMPGRMLDGFGQHGRVFDDEDDETQQERPSMLGAPLQSWQQATPIGFPFPSHNPGLGRLPQQIGNKISPSPSASQTPTDALSGTKTTSVSPTVSLSSSSRASAPSSSSNSYAYGSSSPPDNYTSSAKSMTDPDHSVFTIIVGLFITIMLL
jgi:hypothetical protein